MNWTFSSMTQMSGSEVSLKNPKVRLISPTKIAACCVIKSDAKVSPIRMPRYLARSPTSIFHAMKFMASFLSARPARKS